MEKDGGAKKKEKRPKFGEKIEGKNIYVGESSRSLFERSKEHIKSGEEKREESFIAKHWQESHPDMRKVPEFRFKIVRSYRDPLTRQVGESVRIDMRKGVLNSKTMYSRNTLPRLVLEKTDKEKKYEEFEKEKEKMEERTKRMEWLRITESGRKPLGPEETEDEKIERINGEAWHRELVEKEKGVKRHDDDDEDKNELAEQPKKRKRREKGWRREEDHSWGLESGGMGEAESNTIFEWLRSSADQAGSVIVGENIKIQEDLLLGENDEGTQEHAENVELVPHDETLLISENANGETGEDEYDSSEQGGAGQVDEDIYKDVNLLGENDGWRMCAENVLAITYLGEKTLAITFESKIEERAVSNICGPAEIVSILPKPRISVMTCSKQKEVVGGYKSLKPPISHQTVTMPIPKIDGPDKVNNLEGYKSTKPPIFVTKYCQYKGSKGKTNSSVTRSAGGQGSAVGHPGGGVCQAVLDEGGVGLAWSAGQAATDRAKRSGMNLNISIFDRAPSEADGLGQVLQGGEAGLAVQEDEHDAFPLSAAIVIEKKGVKHAVKEWESKNTMGDTQEVKVESKVRAMASKLEDKVKDGKPARKKYKQGARVIKQEIELGIQPMIGRFLNDHGLIKRVPGGQREGGGDSGGGCVASTSRIHNIN